MIELVLQLEDNLRLIQPSITIQYHPHTFVGDIIISTHNDQILDDKILAIFKLSYPGWCPAKEQKKLHLPEREVPSILANSLMRKEMYHFKLGIMEKKLGRIL